MYIIIGILGFFLLSPLIIWFVVVKLTERERPKGFGRKAYVKAETKRRGVQKASDWLKPHKPNVVLKSYRIECVLVASALLINGAYGLTFGELFWPFYMYGNAVIAMFLSSALFATYLITIVVDHYDKRDNEFTYTVIRRVAIWSGGFFFLLSWLIWSNEFVMVN